MKLTKMLAVCAVTVTAIAAMAMSASAELDATTVTASYTAATDDDPAIITLANVPTVTGADDATLLVLNSDVFADFDSGASETVDITPAVIENINQSADTTDFASIPINELTEGETVYVRIQIDGKIYTAEYTLPKTTPTYTLGDVNDDESIDISDALLAMQSYANLVTLTNAQELAANVNFDETIDISDALLMMQHYAKLITEFTTN